MTSEQLDVRSELSMCPADRPEQWDGVRVEGMVDAPQHISLQELSDMPQTESVQDLRCHDGWVAPGQRWEGVALSDVLVRAGYSEDAGFVVASCLNTQ
jgi:DMSO/TMAO reductase YedYZ molybdopterin-dependent catalytic subunit